MLFIRKAPCPSCLPEPTHLVIPGASRNPLLQRSTCRPTAELRRRATDPGFRRSDGQRALRPSDAQSCVGLYRSTHMATPMPPPMQSVASAFLAALHLVEKRHQHARARGADRVADGDGAAIDVDDLRVPAHVLVDRAGLGR